MNAVRYYFNVSFDCQDKKYICILTDGKKPVCGISSGDFETVISWVNRKKENIWHNEIYSKKKFTEVLL